MKYDACVAPGISWSFGKRVSFYRFVFSWSFYRFRYRYTEIVSVRYFLSYCFQIHSGSCFKTPLGSIAVSTARQISHGPATSTTGVWNVLCHIYQEQKKLWENMIFTIRVLSRLTAVLTWAASLGWTSAVTCCNIYRECHVPVVCEFLHHHKRTSILLASSLK